MILRVAENKRYIVDERGEPFFWTADTAWELFHKLSREEAVDYLKARRDQGFNVVLAVALSEFDGLEVPNFYGRTPLLRDSAGRYDPCVPDTGGEYSYWDHLDYVVGEAVRMGMVMALLPTWGDKYNVLHGKGPDIFTESNALTYGNWIATRLAKFRSLVWVLGGDRPLTTARHFGVIRQMALGIREVDSVSLMTFHPMGGFSSSWHCHDEPWLDFNMVQSGHGTDPAPHYEIMMKDFERSPTKPCVEGETNYEDHPIAFKTANGYFDDTDVRRSSYYAVFAGSCGITYGNHCVWSMRGEAEKDKKAWQENYFLMTWRQALNRPGAQQIKYIRQLVEGYNWGSRVPDPGMVSKNFDGQNHIQACRGADYAWLYVPNGIAVTVVMGRIKGKSVKASWYDPRSGERLAIGTFDNSGETAFEPPAHGRSSDFVLILESVKG